MILMVNSGGRGALPEWQEHFGKVAPHLDIHWFGDPAVKPEDVHYAMVWAPKPGMLAALPNLRLILSSAAGVDHITADPDWPRHLSIVRMGGEETGQRMGEFVCMAALCLMREMPRMIAGQAAREWRHYPNQRTAPETRVGVMGLGNLGSAAAVMLGRLGFPVAGWSRSPKVIAGVECFAGPGERDAFLARTDILVNLLPDTPETRGILCASTLALLPPEAGVVNAGRGPHLVMPDLIAALDSGHLSGAFLDVFDIEPLPADDPVWTHPKVMITPHVASMASRPARAQYVADVIAAFERGEALPNVYDPARGY